MTSAFPLRGLLCGLALGVCVLQWQPSLPGWPFLIGSLSCMLAALAAGMRAGHPALRSMAGVIAGILLGFCWAAALAHLRLSEELPPAWEGRDIALVGTVADLPAATARGQRFRFRVESAHGDGNAIRGIPRDVSLAWYGGFGADVREAPPEVRPGERWQLTARLQRPHGNANPHGFDTEAWMLSQGVRATGYVRDGHAARRLDAFVPTPSHAVHRARGWLRERIERALPDAPYAGVIVALVIGDQRGIGESDREIFNRTGIGHLVSISGLHITMVAGLFSALMFHLWRHSFFTGAQLPLRLPAQKAAAAAGALAAFAYVCLAGFGVPAQRTLYMLAVVAAALWAGGIASVSHVLCVALGAVVLLDPWAVLWPGFWLSFGAVAAILYATAGRAEAFALAEAGGLARLWKTVLAAGRTQYAVTIALVPLTMLLFGQVSLVGPLANAVAIPLVSLVVTPLALAGSVLPAPLIGWTLGIAHALMAWLAVLLEAMSGMAAAIWTGPVPSPWIFACAVAGAAWLLAPRGWPWRWLGLVGWLPLLLNRPAHPAEGELWVTAFDVGQGSALLVETARHRLLVDTGPAYPGQGDAGARIILPYLRGRGIDRLDGMVVSHADIDHAGGAPSLLQGVEVGWLSTSMDERHPLVRAASAHVRCMAGQRWEWDGVRFEMLHPAPSTYASVKWNSNDNARSCTLRVATGDRSILLPGDIGRAQELQILAAQPDKLPSTVLVAPHHGSGTSSSEEFLTAVAPEVALFQVGHRNRYRHPKAEVYERYRQHGIRRVRTDASGAIAVQFGSSMQIEEYRTARARYWHGR